MATEFVTAVQMADATGVDPKAFRQALRDQHFPWHSHNEPWEVQKDSPEHRAMLRVLKTFAGGSDALRPQGEKRSANVVGKVVLTAMLMISGAVLAVLQYRTRNEK